MPSHLSGTALVSGATAGIGLEFARTLAAQGHELVVVARDGARLQQVADQLRAEFGVGVEVLAADLCDRTQVERVADRLRDTADPVDILVNNAGFGLAQRFVGGDLEREEAMLAVLVTAVLVLSHAAAPGMAARGRGQIINVSSVASFLTTGTYSAAKAWVTTFTASLAIELDGTGVTATAVCPGFVRTEFHQRLGARGPVAPAWAYVPVTEVVNTALAAAVAGRPVSIPTRRYRTVVALARQLPLRLSHRVNRRLAGGRRGRGRQR